jgi:Uma2 family endonuclease
MVSSLSFSPELVYPESDGKPMSDNTKQYRWIVTIKENSEVLLNDRSEVFIAGDLLWYPVEGHPEICQAPDVMIVFGRPKGDRGSYQQWKEENIPPQIAFEILSPCNTKREMASKRDFYEKYGVEEYYVYDPDRFRLSGWIRQAEQLVPIASMENWVSPRLGIRFTQVNGDLEIYRSDGRRFLSSIEMDRRAELERQRAESADKRAESADKRAESADQRAEALNQRTEQLESQVRSAVVNLLGMGLSAQQVSIALGLTLEEVEPIELS